MATEDDSRKESPPAEGSSSASALTPQPSSSFWSNALDVFIAPGAAFARIARKPDFLAPLLVLIGASVAVSEGILAKIGMARIIRASIEHSSRGSTMTPEQVDEAVRRGAQFATVFGHVVAVLGPPVLLLVLAGLGLLVVNGVFGGEVRFKTAFTVTCYSRLVGVLEAVMALALVWFGDPENFNPQNPAPSNVGFFLHPFDTPKPLLALASSVDVFTLWSLVLLGIGLSAATEGKVKARGVVLTLLGFWLIYVLARVGLATLF